MKIASHRMFGPAITLAGAGLFALLSASTALASGACPDTIRAAADGPQPQGIAAALAPDRKSVTATTWIAPCPRNFADVEVSFSLFDSDGAFLNIAPQGPPPALPADPQSVQGIIAVDPAWADRLLKKILVEVMWDACPDSIGTDCAAKAWHMHAFLMDVPSFTQPAHR